MESKKILLELYTLIDSEELRICDGCILVGDDYCEFSQYKKCKKRKKWAELIARCKKIFGKINHKE